MSTINGGIPTTVTRKKGLARFEPTLVDDVVFFQRTAYPHRRKDWIEPRWRWMYLDSADRLRVEPMVWLYHDGERVVAHQGGIPVRLKIDTQEITTGWFVETMALESARGRTVGPAVIMKAAEDLPFNISLGQTPAMRELQYRLGWVKVADLQTAQLLLNPSGVLRDKLKIAPAAFAAGAAFRGWSAMRRLASRASLAGFEVAEVDRFGSGHDRLWERVQRDLMCAVVRDASYLNWKYVGQPGQAFHRLELRRDGEPVAVVVLSIAEPQGEYRYRRGFLVEILAPLSDRQILQAALEAVRGHAVQHGCDAIVCHHIDKRLTTALSSAGYLRREPTRFLLVRPGSSTPDIRDRVLDGNNWFVTMGDSDIDRPW